MNSKVNGSAQAGRSGPNNNNGVMSWRSGKLIRTAVVLINWVGISFAHSSINLCLPSLEADPKLPDRVQQSRYVAKQCHQIHPTTFAHQMAGSVRI